ncbi:Long chain acyl-CoA synthetase 6 [Lathyrus oleraceus]|uniref:Long chain acyl-CoA synthetase 6 n=1 Tax=Pisum sativum TaxID=3888 RepID=A0A9D5AV69_PEA|nr:Long chain acyl-CoA synthetase 6 [Pisum sativum]
MNYTSDDQRNPCGEICIRGPIIFQGYYKDEVQTREVIDEEGWLHTGDIGTWIAGGRLKIIDRKKIIFKLAQGEYISPEKIENVYVKCNFVAQCFIYGGNFNSSLVAVVSVDPDVMKAWAASQGIVHNDLTQLCNNPKQAPFHTLIGRELRNGKVENPFVKYGQAGLAKKGEDYFLIKTDCHRVPGDPSTAFSVFAVFDGHNGISAATEPQMVSPKQQAAI